MRSEKFCVRDGISIMLVTKYKNDTCIEQWFLIVLQLQHHALKKSVFFLNEALIYKEPTRCNFGLYCYLLTRP